MSAARQPLRYGNDDQGSMPIAMLVTTVALGLSVVLSTLVIAQIGSTQFALRRASGLQSARAGLDVAVANLRAATSGGVSPTTLTGTAGSLQGDRTKLPCGTMTDAASPGSSATFVVQIEYFATDPQSGTAAPVACQSGQGPGTDAMYARLTSTGYDSAGKASRKLVATYPLLSGDPNLAGDTIHLNSTNLCLDAGDAPVAGRQILLQDCAISTRPKSQLFAYGSNLGVKLASSVTAAYPAGLCVDAPSTDGATLSLAACGAPANQQWIASGAAASGGGTWMSYSQTLCWRVAALTTGSTVKLDANCGNASTFLSHGSAGAGAAMLSARNQWVDYAEFNRCIDVSNDKVSDLRLVTSPCTQNLTTVDWSQSWTPVDATTGAAVTLGNSVDGVGNVLFTVTDNDGNPANPDGRYCLWSPGAGSLKVQAKSCSTAAEFRWTITRNTGQSATSYEIKDTYARCLTAVRQDVVADAGAPANVSILRTMPCDGSDQQKWNAPPTVQISSPLLDVAER